MYSTTRVRASSAQTSALSENCGARGPADSESAPRADLHAHSVERDGVARHGHHGRRRGNWRRLVGDNRGVRGERERKDRPPAYLAASSQVAQHRPREVPADGEAKPGSLRRPREIHLQPGERLEDRIELFARYTVAGVADANLHPSGVQAAGNPYASTRRRVLDGVRQQVEHDLLDARPVPVRDEAALARAVVVDVGQVSRLELRRDERLEVT